MIHFKDNGGDIVFVPFFGFASQGFLTIELLDTNQFKLKRYPRMAYDSLQSIILTLPEIAQLGVWGIKAIFTIGSPDEGYAYIDVIQDNIKIGRLECGPFDAKNGVNMSVREQLVSF